VTTSLSFGALGTTAGLHVTDASGLAAAEEILVAELDAIDRACSRFRDDSELALLNAAGGRPFPAGDLLLEAVEAALRAARITDGAVDPTVGRALRAIGYDRDFGEIKGAAGTARVHIEEVAGWRSVRLDRERRTIQIPDGVELDLGATAKALAADRAAALAHSGAGCGVLVNLGGDVAIAGPPPPGGWKVLVTDDHANGRAGMGQTVYVSGGGLATSSTTVRRWATERGDFHHVVDPTTGLPAAETWRTVSVAAGSCVDANIATTAAIVRGEAAVAWIDGLGLPGRFVRPSGSVVRIGSWPDPPV
jgi:thiamine biosynthesis lipoprotein